MLSLTPDRDHRSPSIARLRRSASAALTALLAVGAAGTLAGAAAVQRAAISSTRLAAEIDGVLYLEVLGEGGDTAAILARTYAGSAAAATALRAANDGVEPAPGAFYRLPYEALTNEHRRFVLAALYPEEVPPSPLEFSEDEGGPYALYRLLPGEALYSAVAVRFTGRVDPAEVNALAEVIARRSGVPDVRRIPAGYAVKIPLDLVLPEYLPAGAPQRSEVEAAVAASARHRLSAGAVRLAGVHVILDAGHGGDDSGAVRAGVVEDEYAYDVMCRIRALLLRETAAQVVTTIRDRSSGYRVLDGKIRRDRDEFLLTDPPYDLRSPGATTKGVNLRWRLANREFARLVAQGVSAERAVFISLHADSLHPAIRGTMVYVPGRDHRRADPAGATAAELERAEGLSRALARQVVGRLRGARLPVHTFLPIRDHVIRSGRRWIPAVLRASRVPHSILIEIANLNNDEDRALLTQTSFREVVAEAVVEALVSHYTEEPAARTAEVARRAVGPDAP